MEKKETYIKQALFYYKPIWLQLIFCMIIGLTRMGIMLVEPQIISLMVDRVIKPALGYESVGNSSIFSFLIEDIPKDNLWTIMGVLSVAFLVLMAIYFITFYARWNIIHYCSQKVENKMRTQMLGQVNKIGPRVLKQYTNGQLISIINGDTRTVKEFFIATIPFIFDSLFYIVMAAYFLFRTSILLMIAPILTFAVYAVITKGFIKKCGVYYDNMWEENAKLNTEAQESIYGIRTIKAYAREKYRYKRFAKKSDELKKFYIEFGNTKYKYFWFYDATDQILMLITMAISIYLASQFKMTDGEYTAFLGYLLTMVGCFVDIIFLMGDVERFKVSAKRAFGFIEYKNDVDEKFGNKSVGSTPHIKVTNLTKEADGKTLIKDISVDIPYGKKIGIMGKTGSGKSVFLKALQGFDEFTSGTIQIDGDDFYDYDRRQIAKAFGFAMQDVFLFSNTIAANIEFYNPKGDMERIKQCGRLAEVDEFAYSFEDGYNTIVGEKGFGLSGGQKQRVAIARALYKDAPVLVLDDCTSALDMETEHKIFANINDTIGDKTLLLATHRAYALKDFDEIILFEEGEIVERGTFKELMSYDTRYRKTYIRQMGGEYGKELIL